DLYNVGGIPGVMKILLDAGLLHGDCLTVTGKTIAENLAEYPNLDIGQKVITEINHPKRPDGPLIILKGNLSPAGAVAKVSSDIVTSDVIKHKTSMYVSEEILDERSKYWVAP